MVGYLVSDILYAVVDPRISYKYNMQDQNKISHLVNMLGISLKE